MRNNGSLVNPIFKVTRAKAIFHIWDFESDTHALGLEVFIIMSVDASSEKLTNILLTKLLAFKNSHLSQLD